MMSQSKTDKYGQKKLQWIPYVMENRIGTVWIILEHKKALERARY